MQSILRALREDPFRNIESLSDLNQALCLINDPGILMLSMQGQSKSFLVMILETLETNFMINAEDPEILILVVRAVLNLLSIEGDGGFIARTLINRKNIMDNLCRHITSIQFIDIAELVLSVLERISRVTPSSLWKYGGLNLFLSYLDFFSLSSQKIAVSGAANMCKRIPREYLTAARDEGIPNLSVLVRIGLDEKILEQICLALSEVVMALHDSNESDSLVFDTKIILKLTSLLTDLKSSDCINVVIKTVLKIVKWGPSSALIETLNSSDCLILFFETVIDKREWETCRFMLLLFLELYPYVVKGRGIKLNSELLLNEVEIGAMEVRKLINLVTNFAGMIVDSEEHNSNTNNELALKKSQETKIFLVEKHFALFGELANRLAKIILQIQTTDSKLLFSMIVLFNRIFSHINTVSASLRRFIMKLFHSCDLDILIAVFDLLENAFESRKLLINDFIREGINLELLSLVRDLDVNAGILKKFRAIRSKSIEDAVKSDCNLFLSMYGKYKNLKCFLPLSDYENVPASSQSNVSDETTKQISVWLKYRACSFYEKYFGSLPKDCQSFDADIKKFFGDNFRQLLPLKARLNEDLSPDELANILSSISNVIPKMTCYEIKKSDIISTLLSFIQSQHYLPFFDRWSIISSHFEMSKVVKALGNYVEQYLRFPIIKFDVSSSILSDGLNGKPIKTLASLKYLASPIVVKLISRDDGTEVKTRIEPLATMHQMDKFLSKLGANQNEMTDDEKFDSEESSGSMDISSFYGEEKDDEQSLVDFSYYINGEKIEKQSNILQLAISSIRDGGLAKIWSTTINIEYSRSLQSNTHDPAKLHSSILLVKPNFETMVLSMFRTTVNNQKYYEPLQLLLALSVLNEYVSKNPIPAHSFINSSISFKVECQLNEPLLVCARKMPNWLDMCFTHYSFLFPYELKLQYFECLKTDVPRALHRMISAVDTTTPVRVARIKRLKFKVDRDHLMKCAFKILETHSNSRKIIEIQFRNEVGTGLGPTLEFYSDICQKFALSNDLWWKSDLGLYPAPMSVKQSYSNPGRERIKCFKMLGKFIARAIYDSRPLDINLNVLFIMQILDMEFEISIKTLEKIDPVLSRSLQQILDMEDPSSLGLDFTFPGIPEIELTSLGHRTPVTMNNVKDYIQLVLEWSFSTGIQKQLCAFRDGFNSVISCKSLALFTINEIQYRLAGYEQEWSTEILEKSIAADHGYSIESSPVKFLINYMLALDREGRRRFLMFLTGSPNLPVGGIEKLTPKLTVVRKLPEGVLTSDYLLPSVMTCVNYLKLPEYSSFEVLSEKMNLALKEGQGSFHLS